MPSAYPRFARNLTLFGSCGLVFLAACAPKERDLSQLKPNSISSGGSSIGGGTSSTAGRGATGSTTGGATATVQAGTSSVGTAGSVTAGGVPSSGGLPAQGGQLSTGGTLGVAGGTTVQGGGGGAAPGDGGASGAIGAGGVVSAAGATGVGGAIGNGGATGGVGGAIGIGGAIGNGGVAGCGTEVCNDGIDNDCNGNVDCPIVTGRYPDPSRASAGDDAWVQLTPPVKTIKQVECRSGKPGAAVTKPWLVCDTTNPTALTVYSMGLAEAKLPTGNGVTQFDFRFVFTDGKVSDPRSIVYYAHNSLADAVMGTPELACPVAQPDSRYFDVARTYIAPDTTTPTFATTDLQLKSPFISLRFHPAFGGDNYIKTTTPSEIKVLSLRHRFAVDPGKQMLLVTRAYKSTRGGATCAVAAIEDRDTSTYMTGTTTHYLKNHLRSYCDAIVINRAGTGVCIRDNNGTLAVPNLNSNKVITFLNRIGIPWPKADPMMYQKLFDSHSAPASLSQDFFSPKCPTEDAVCRTANAAALVLPDSGDVYFTTP